ncbi:phosphatase PAP2 family protein [Candidatus Daviesbacteria bacterium]|nr:phosphatase PAP2 family protein [Candidatus Daviesbacteria bacterium]
MDNQTLFFEIYNLSHKSPLIDTLMIFITDYVIYLTILFVFILGIIGKAEDKKAFLLTVLAIPVSILVIKLIHLFILEPRPFVTFHFSPLTDQTADASFPSRHATIMAVIAFTYTYLKSKWSLLFLLLMILVGFSRIYVGVHYPQDIAGGFAAGLISLITALELKKILKLGFFD